MKISKTVNKCSANENNYMTLLTHLFIQILAKLNCNCDVDAEELDIDCTVAAPLKSCFVVLELFRPFFRFVGMALRPF